MLLDPCSKSKLNLCIISLIAQGIASLQEVTIQAGTPTKHLLEDRASVEVAVSPTSDRLQLLEPFNTWDGKDYTDSMYFSWHDGSLH